METKDKNGNIVRIGDRVKYSNYTFTVEEFGYMGWIWGSDMPEDVRHTTPQRLRKNYHKGSACELIMYTKTWADSKLTFKFI